MIGIIFATRMEAAPFLEAVNAAPVDESPLTLFHGALPREGKGLFVAISGMGGINAAIATQALILSYGVRRIVHAGICGALSTGEGIETHDVFRIKEAVKADRKRTYHCDPEWWGFLEDARLVTSDAPVFDEEQRERLALKGGLVDMEGAVVCRVSKMYSLPCSIIKGVTDFADSQGEKMVKKNIGPVSQKVAATLLGELKRRDPEPQPLKECGNN